MSTLLAQASTVLGFAGAVLAFALAAVVLRMGRGGFADRTLAALLILEGLLQAAFSAAGLSIRWEEHWVSLAFWATTVLGLLYLLFISVLETPLVGWIRRRPVRWILAVVLGVVPTIALAGSFAIMGRPGWVPGDINMAIVPLVFGTAAFVFISLYALVAAISTFRRAKGTARRAQARAYVTAFGVHDVLFIIGYGSNFLAGTIVPRVGIPESQFLLISSLAAAFATILFVPLLAYGLLKTQLFDIDLKIKAGVSRTTVATIGIIVVLAAAKMTELYVSRQWGIAAGGGAAGVLLFLVPRLNRLGDKVANKAMPNVQPTPIYLAFKKLEVYRAAVESAQETGGITDRERASLDRLREKLGLSKEDTGAVESEVLAIVSNPSTPTVPSPNV